jgi:acyl dehydratase
MSPTSGTGRSAGTVRPGWRGRFYEDFAVGDIYEHPLGRTVSEADNTWFTLLTMNTSEMHFNEVYAGRSEFGRPLVVSTLTLAVAVGQSVADLTQNAFANLGWDDVRMTAPVFAGDTVWSESIVLETRESASRPAAGIVTVRTRTLNQRAEQVCSFRRAFYVHKRGALPADGVRPRATAPLTLEDLEGTS